MESSNQNSNLSSLPIIRINRIREQGYTSQTNIEIQDLAYGNRFAYRLCVSLLIFGVAFAYIPLLTIMMFVAFFGVILPNHPFDYIYNIGLSRRMNKPKLPPRSNQLKFACSIATVWLAGVIYLFYSGLTYWGYIVGAMLIGVAGLVSTIDLCIPSKIYNALFQRNPKATESKV